MVDDEVGNDLLKDSGNDLFRNPPSLEVHSHGIPEFGKGEEFRYAFLLPSGYHGEAPPVCITEFVKVDNTIFIKASDPAGEIVGLE